MENWLNHIKKFDLKRRKSCYKKGAAIKVFLDETNNEEKFKLLNHIFNCPECGIEFESVKEIWTKGKDILLELEKEKFTKENAKQIKKIAKKEIRTLKSKKTTKRITFFHLKKFPAIATGIIIVFIISLFFLIRGPKDIELERKINRGNIEAIEPWGEIHKSSIFFRWTPIKEAKNYTLEILDSGLETFYRKEQIKAENFILPEEIFIRLTKRETYFWKVIANMENDQKIESEFGKFYINNN